MLKKLAKIKYLPNNFKILEKGDYVLCAVSGRKISLENLNYWNVDTQEAYYSYKEAHLKIADVKTGNVESVYKEVTKTYYESGVNGENWRVFFKTNEFLWYSEKDDWGHLYLHDLTTGKLKNQITNLVKYWRR